MADPLEIDQGIPLPLGRGLLSVMERLKPGDSVFVPEAVPKSRLYNGVMNKIASLKKRGWVCVAKSQTEEGVAGVRVWRTD